MTGFMGEKWPPESSACDRSAWAQPDDRPEWTRPPDDQQAWAQPPDDVSSDVSSIVPPAARSRAIAAAQAVLHQPGAADAARAWQAVGELNRIGAELRAACEAAASAPWLAAAVALLVRLEEAAAWWTGQARFPWATWDETASSELGMLLCELDALAADLITAAGPGDLISAANPGPANPITAAGPSDLISATGPAPANLISAASPGDLISAAGPDPADHLSAANLGSANFISATDPGPASPPVGDPIPPPLPDPAPAPSAPCLEPTVPRPARRPSPRLLPTIGLAAAAMVGVIGGITYATTHASHAADAQRRDIAGEPVPFTLHGSDSADARAQPDAAASLPATSDPASAIGVPGNLAGAPLAASSAASAGANPLGALLAAAHVSHKPETSPRHAAPRVHQLSGPQLPALSPYQAQLELLNAAIRAANAQDPQLGSFTQHVQNEFPLGAP